MRHPVRVGLVVLLALLASRGHGAAQEAQLTVEVPSGEWAVGDHVVVTLRLALPGAMEDATPRFPQWQERWGEAEVVAAGAPQRQHTADGGVEWIQRVTLAAFRPGAIPLPPREVVVPLAAGSVLLRSPADLRLDLRSVLPADVPREQLAPRDPAPLRSLPLGHRFWWTLAAGALLVAAALAAAWRQHPRSAASAPAVLPDPRYELEAALAGLVEEIDGLRFHAGLSRAVRRYLGRTLQFAALESTTREIQRHLAHHHLSRESVRAATELLIECDGVKFARRPPRAAREQLVASARHLAEQVEAHLAVRQTAEREAA